MFTFDSKVNGKQYERSYYILTVEKETKHKDIHIKQHSNEKKHRNHLTQL